jgi:hypothetical protein
VDCLRGRVFGGAGGFVVAMVLADCAMQYLLAVLLFVGLMALVLAMEGFSLVLRVINWALRLMCDAVEALED